MHWNAMNSDCVHPDRMVDNRVKRMFDAAIRGAQKRRRTLINTERAADTRVLLQQKEKVLNHICSFQAERRFPRPKTN